jgi:hypothetical protein
MIFPYETPEAIHTAGLSIPLDAYVNLIYSAKSFTVDCQVDYDTPFGVQTMAMSGTLDRQYFTGPEPILDESLWSSNQMTTATRRVCYGLDGASPLAYHDPADYLPSGGTKVIAGWMNWFGELDWSYTDEFSTSTSTKTHNFYLPVANFPLYWDDGATEEVVSGVKKGTGLADWLIYMIGTFDCPVDPSLNPFYGSHQHVGLALGSPIAATLVTPGGTYDFLGAGLPAGLTPATGYCTITQATTW